LNNHFGSVPTWFNSKLELANEPGWQVLRSNRLIRFNDTAKKISILLTLFLNLEKEKSDPQQSACGYASYNYNKS
jgi:hypothetical protein